jgi:hypothetical protein
MTPHTRMQAHFTKSDPSVMLRGVHFGDLHFVDWLHRGAQVRPRNPKPETGTRSPRPETLNPFPDTRDLRTEARSPELGT